jgi:hypothetical protein
MDRADNIASGLTNLNEGVVTARGGAAGSVASAGRPKRTFAAINTKRPMRRMPPSEYVANIVFNLGSFIALLIVE